MTTFPNQLMNRAAATIARTADLVANAHQRLNNIGSQVSSLTPGDWEPLTLSGGWSNLPGYIPAQARILQAGLVQLVGHIEGGTTANGTVIGTLTAGYFDATYSHAFTANVLTGAAAVSVSGAISGSTDINALTDGGVSGGTTSNGLTNGGVSGSTTANTLADGSTGGTSGSTTATTGVAHTHAAGSYGVNNGSHVHSASSMSVVNAAHVHSAGSMSVNDSNHTHTNASGNQNSATPVNYNTVILTLDTSGNLTITNCSSAATQLSFNENLPLIGS